MIAACAAFDRLRDAFPPPVGTQRVYGTPACEDYERKAEQLEDRESDLVHEIAGRPAMSLAGLQAKTRILLRWYDGDIRGDEDQPAGDRLLWSIIQDILGRSGVS